MLKPQSMDPQRWALARKLFDDLVELTNAERARQLTIATEGDAALREALQSLLSSHEYLSDTGQDPLAHAIEKTVAELWPAAVAGERFGAFSILKEIGRGGMGIVYLAERCDGTVEQRVALKILAHSRHDEASVHRLNRERRLLAGLEHPHIARLIDAGENENGTPYFAMEYISGVAITRYCDEHALPLPQRLRLFLEVCTAVQYAHRKLVVHGDLKPGNILVTQGGIPKLLDFGIAVSLTQGATSAATLAVADSGQRFFSANSAAPEQLAGQPSSIATDVYALGGLLCELLGGKRPFDLRQKSAEQIADIVAHDPPQLPSLAATAAAAAVRGGLSLRRLQRCLRGDLDAIVAKALSKQPAQRYASVEQLHADISSHLALHPISARSGERGYRGKRFVRRNAVWVGFSLVLAALLLGFLLYGLAQNQRLAAERDLARQQKEQAQFERDRAAQVTSFLIDLFRAADPAQMQGKDVTARQLLERGTRRLQSDLTQQPELRAAILAAIADIYIELDELESAERAAEEAWNLRSSRHPEDAVGLSASLRQRARLALLRGKAADGLSLVEQAIELQPDDDAETRIAALSIKAKAIEGVGRPHDAESVWREALATSKLSPSTRDAHSLRLAGNLSHLLRALGKLPEAEAVLRDNLPAARKSSSDGDTIFAASSLELAMYARNKGDLQEADRLASTALDIYVELYGEASSQAASAANTLATVAQARGDDQAARALFERSLSSKQAVFGANNPRVAAAEYNLGLLYLLRLNDARQAEAHLRRAVDIGAETLPAAHSNLANYRLGLGSALRDLGRLDEAQSILRPALLGFEQIDAPQGIDLALTRGELACARLAANPDDRLARRQLIEAIATLRQFAADEEQSARVFQCAKS